MGEPVFATWLWNTLAATGDLEAELMRMHAVAEAAAEASRRKLSARAVDRYLAAAHRLALAKRVRAEFFPPSAALMR